MDCRDGKTVLVTLGVFTIVQLIRNVQMLMPVYDYCMPNKECTPTSENPCDLFHKMCFPVNEFFPPACEGDGGGNVLDCFVSSDLENWDRSVVLTFPENIRLYKL